MWADVVSDSAQELYEQLITSGGRAVCEGLPGVARDDPALLELIGRGLVRETADPAPRVYGVAPAVAMRRLMAHERQVLLQAHQRVVRHYAELERLERRYATGTGDPAGWPGGEVRRGAEVIAALAHELAASARGECRIMYGPDTSDLPASPAAGPGRPVRHRALLDPQVLADEGRRDMVDRATTAGVEHRILDDLPAPMTVTDDAALVRTRPDRADEVVLIRSPALVTSLARLFDLLWTGATPLAPVVLDAPDAPPAVQLQILRLAAMGLKDEAIARSLGRSSRWVRRHVECLEERLGATNRLTLGVAAARRGWV
jgi:DNA-binding CsgD family transcriptional regulator